jgi:hypothetical protein
MITVLRILVDTTRTSGMVHGGLALPLPLLVGSRDGLPRAGYAALASFASHVSQWFPRLFRIHSQQSWIYCQQFLISHRYSTQGPLSGAVKSLFHGEDLGWTIFHLLPSILPFTKMRVTSMAGNYSAIVPSVEETGKQFCWRRREEMIGSCSTLMRIRLSNTIWQ